MSSILGPFYYLFHIQELRAIVQWKTWRRPVHERHKAAESHDVKECFRFLALTSRSFVAVVLELHPELFMPVCIFYLILRGLDTIEDDMTISIGNKEVLLRNFHTHIDDESWTYNGNGPDEKDKELLVKFGCVTREFNKIKDEYKTVIKDITKRMGNGMADYVTDAEVRTTKDYELYCHHVAGLVGEGLTRLLIKANFADPKLLEEPKLMESMGQLLQQTNIIRDVHEDHKEKRYFWPKEVWGKYTDDFAKLFLRQHRQKALQCSSEMVLIALTRVEDCLIYMARVYDQSVFNFVAIPQSMAIATLELCFQNPAIFERNIKISKGAACQLMLESTKDMQSLCAAFMRYSKRIQEKNRPGDPLFHGINSACDKIERFAVTLFPNLNDTYDGKDPMYLIIVMLMTLGAVMAVVLCYRG
ncbi:farnesyl-diphosphate farnesyl transferase-like protein [Pyrenochaeta sp. MPI-SDFR-AT-0127]|nr:farnesyl-diphosphate farnesyl transferase-like protein [Pyrenochaeta sp. MPI-SDFR-AT-0127]